MTLLKKLQKTLSSPASDEKFLDFVHLVEKLVSKVLSVSLLLVIAVALFDLIYILCRDIITSDPVGFYNQKIIEVFGLFLNILIALELLENVTAYLKKNIIHVELVIVTALIAVSRKIIIFDSKTQKSQDLIAISIGILALSISYCLVRNTRSKE
jgi:uncharacterized membrane protein (DUF373 family)